MPALLLEIVLALILLATGVAQRHWKLFAVAGALLFLYAVWTVSDTAMRLAAVVLGAASFAFGSMALLFKLFTGAFLLLSVNWLAGFPIGVLDFVYKLIPRKKGSTDLSTTLSTGG